MKTFTAKSLGEPNVLAPIEAPTPEPGAGKVLIRTHYFSTNPVDFKMLSSDRYGTRFPFVPGLDVSGVVEKVGASVNRFKTGDEVLAKLPIAKAGGYAEFALAEENMVVLKNGIPFEEAAAVPLVSLTAWQALFDQGELKSGQKVLILGGSGGVGTFAIQFAHNAGAHVSTTCSSRNVALLKELGAGNVIDYSKDKFYEILKDQDLVIDAIGNDESIHHATDVLRPGGKSVSVTQPSVSPRVDSGEVNAVRFMTKDDGAQLEHITSMVSSGKVRVIVDQVLDFTETVKALELQKVGHVTGKLVVKVI